MDQREINAMRLASELLASDPADWHDQESAALAIRNTFQQMTSCLSLRIGRIGVRALLSRSLHLATVDSPWLASVHIDEYLTLVGLGEAMAGRSLEESTNGIKALLASLVGLLENLIGEELSQNLLREIRLVECHVDVPIDDREGER